jgi:hypothetical protein
VPLPDSVRSVLPADTAKVWEILAPLVPDQVYLGGGTALAVHLTHRLSRDLDFFFHANELDLDRLAASLSELGPFAVTQRVPGTLNGVFSKTKVQFLHADERKPQRRLEPLTRVAGLSIAGVADLMAMKLKVVGDRGELRDYFDIMTMEEKAGMRVEEGLDYFVERYQPESPAQGIDHIVRGLGYFDDVLADDSLPVDREAIVAYWRRRQPEILRAVSRFRL